MPRTRLVWQLFAGWCGLVAAVLFGCLWLGSVQLARLATEAQRQRLFELGRGLAGVLGDTSSAGGAFQSEFEKFATAADIEVRILAGDGSGLAHRADAGQLTRPLLAETRQGRAASDIRYDIATGRRRLVVAVPEGEPGQPPRRIVQLAADTAQPDGALRRAQARLAGGLLAAASAAIAGGWLVQDAHHFARHRADWEVVTKREPTDDEWSDAELAWRVCGHVRSNAIVLVHDGVAWGIGAGQQNRVESGEIAAKKAAGRAAGGACASDAFYPFPDGVEAAAAAGVAVVIQPGGSVRDADVIARADELGLAMVLTGERHFLH